MKYNSVTVSKAEIPFVVMLCYRKGDFSGLQSCVCCVEPNDDMRRVTIEELQHNAIWSEAAKLRTAGKLLEAFKRIQCKICLIQGVYDPHPVKGVTMPLQENNVPCETYILEKCGHSPFMEKYAKDEFYNILKGIMDDGKQ